MYEAETEGVCVQVTPQFLEDQSDIGQNRFVWAYTVRIENRGADTVQLINRYWRITDARGMTQEVRGPGVVGEQPVLRPGESFEYTSGAPLSTPSGIMVGQYEMARPGGSHFDAAIPAFSLDSPHQQVRLN